MRKVSFFAFGALVLQFGLVSGASAGSKPITITLADVVKKVSTENYLVYGNALRVYEAKEAIKVARGNLLPKLNLWKIAKIVIDPTSVLDLFVEDIAPFAVAGNWFRLDETKILYLAEQEAYRALWANEVMTAKSLYIHLLLDQSLLEHIEQSAKELEELLVIVQSRELLGGANQGASRDIEVRLLALQEDRRSLEVLINEEESLLSYMMGFPAETEVKPAPISMPDFSALEPLDYGDFLFRTLDSSPELRQYNHFIKAADYVKKEAGNWSVLGVSNMSRGVAGGVFDNIPVQDGLGFGKWASQRIVSARKEALQIQKKGIEETIKRQLKLLVNNYNLDLENYASLKKREELTKESIAQLFERLELGQNVEAIELIEASRNHIQADTSFFAVKFRFLSNENKLERLIFHGDYNMKPATIEALRKNKSAAPKKAGKRA